MYAIVETSGRQFRVEEGATITVDHVDAAEGAEITLDKVLLVGGDNGTKVGTPTLDGATVTATVARHFKGDKVITFKYKQRKRSRRRVGFRHSHTELTITGIKA
ncbi:MAG: 50S ribosomal protein L21 [Deltaproteobacteria bacterium]|nr:MAG: 50S ribosomal protein L21 [Deltaproteobacteria bacterium]